MINTNPKKIITWSKRDDENLVVLLNKKDSFYEQISSELRKSDLKSISPQSQTSSELESIKNNWRKIFGEFYDLMASNRTVSFRKGAIPNDPVRLPVINSENDMKNVRKKSNGLNLRRQSNTVILQKNK